MKTIKDYLMEEGLKKIVGKSFYQPKKETSKRIIYYPTYEVMEINDSLILEVKYERKKHSEKISLLKHLNDRERITRLE